MFLRTVSDEDAAREFGKSKTQLSHISLYSGCGGFDIGLSEAGFTSRAMVEFDKNACNTLRHNFLWEYLKERKDQEGKHIWKTKDEMKKEIPWYHDQEPVIFERDIKTLATKELLEGANLKIGETTIITGGPPCQGFSIAGKRVIEDPRNKLFKEFVRVVREALPVFLIMENVPGLVSMAKGEIIKQILEEFANSGYNITWDILNAADYGVPQHRRRVFIIGKRLDVMRFPEEGNPQLHMGAIPGKINHPEFFRVKHGLAKKGQGILTGYKKPDTIMDLMMNLNKASAGQTL